jgi:hypothetical protein
MGTAVDLILASHSLETAVDQRDVAGAPRTVLDWQQISETLGRSIATESGSSAVVTLQAAFNA